MKLLIGSIVVLVFITMGIGMVWGMRYSECRQHGFSKFYCFTGAK